MDRKRKDCSTHDNFIVTCSTNRCIRCSLLLLLLLQTHWLTHSLCLYLYSVPLCCCAICMCVNHRSVSGRRRVASPHRPIPRCTPSWVSSARAARPSLRGALKAIVIPRRCTPIPSRMHTIGHGQVSPAISPAQPHHQCINYAHH